MLHELAYTKYVAYHTCKREPVKTLTQMHCPTYDRHETTLTAWLKYSK